MEEEISLSEIFAILKQRLVQIIIWSLSGLLLAGLYTFFFVTPTYQSTSKIVVNQTQNAEKAITNTDIQTNLSLISTYQGIIKEPIILQDVITNTGSKLSVDQLRSKLTVQTEADSLVFGVTITDENPYTAAELANATASSFEQKIGGILDVNNVTILSEAVANTNAVSPNTPMNLVLGLLVGMMIGVGLAFLAEFMDKTVKDGKFIEQMGWVNLGTVLQMSEEDVTSTRFSPVKEETTTRTTTRRV
ncbi:lipopolysaccharide biosynthesis [Trichococcus palustris]|uniref:Capsular polysaccharide biosynthesis protein CpsC n=1 Tax=Trichococcus palustris TaxID=140314 RepID=A0A143YT95_9LACT|nr:Wzz/FepE/Etk N-terminal domain-containing protein [Trichococcus palustris]CZQ97039.1 lipopolysaccharide biosynthesis [Trichococcus palustris]SFK75208.1 Capsular polysaccharide biosynthesis protein [Trichococcus palustris]